MLTPALSSSLLLINALLGPGLEIDALGELTVVVDFIALER